MILFFVFLTKLNLDFLSIDLITIMSSTPATIGPHSRKKVCYYYDYDVGNYYYGYEIIR